MAWMPDGETKHEERPVTKAELEADLAKHDWQGFRDFIETIKDGDTITYESTRNNNRWLSRYIGRRKYSITYSLVISSGMA